MRRVNANPYQDFVARYAQLVSHGKQLPLGGLPGLPSPQLAPNAPRVLIFSPHPDDEVIIGGLPLRLLREAGMRVINVAVTQGSRKDRQQERWEELSACCRYIGFDLLATTKNGLENINLKTRLQSPDAWEQSVSRIAEILRDQQPKIIFFPHEEDWNSSHIGTHHLVVDALRNVADADMFTVETEFWGAMDTPNLMVESSEQDVVDLISALSFHVGEVRRNPYHVRLPAWLMDNVRRGGELVGGQGAAAPEFTFATLYRVRRWSRGEFKNVFDGGRAISARDDVTRLFLPTR
jgi:N-acetylglucosamine malate deacetylase 1